MTDHAALMDATYRRQRHIYDVTRPLFLRGRSRLIRALDPAPEAKILELACGTGQNLRAIARAYPGRALYGLDISSEMLATAQMKMKGQALLAKGDATGFDAPALFGTDAFDHVVISYALSMIPDWRGAIGEAMRHLAPGGTLHVVDFGDLAGWPRTFRTALTAAVARFHVTPREGLPRALHEAAQAYGGTATTTPLARGYACAGVVRVP
ncbi:MAG: class I SAM-dependent methyltransferase [Pseudomonadota bacterium]